MVAIDSSIWIYAFLKANSNFLRFLPATGGPGVETNEAGTEYLSKKNAGILEQFKEHVSRVRF